MSDWDIVIGIVGFELSEKLRDQFKGERIKVPSKPPKSCIVPLIKEELKEGNYDEIGKKYQLCSATIRRYQKFKILEDRIIAPSGREYFLPGVQGERGKKQ